MSIVERLLSQKLREEKPTLDLEGSDRELLRFACRDFANYLKVHWDLIGKEVSDYEVAERLERISLENLDELNGFVDIWVKAWLKKWEERVKLLIGEDALKSFERIQKVTRNAEPLWEKLPNKQDAIEAIVETLVRNGEICATSVIAENLLKTELSKAGDVELRGELLANIVNNALRSARCLAKSKGPLVYVKIDKGYFSRH